MTPMQMMMYCGDDAALERELQAEGYGGIRIDPKTGRKTVRVKNHEEAARLIAKLQERKRRGQS